VAQAPAHNTRHRTRVPATHLGPDMAMCHDMSYLPLSIPPSLLLPSWMTEEQLDGLTPTMLEGRPNTYTYTKAMAETVLQNDAQGLPLSIIRPSIVTSSLKEPYPGWVDCLHGATGLVVAVRAWWVGGIGKWGGMVRKWVEP